MAVVSALKKRRQKPVLEKSAGLPSKKYGVSVPPRAAYSHSASVGRRYFLPVLSESHWQKVSAA